MSPSPPAERWVRRARWPEPVLMGLVAAGAYCGLAVWAILRHNLVAGDAISRLANASYVIRGRDPHLAAIGFVWNPLPSMIEVPLLELRTLWPTFIDPGLAASIGSALCAGAAVGVLDAVLRQWPTRPSVRWLAVAVVALNPMMLFYAVNGMSEAYFLPWLILTVGGLAGWLRTGRNANLVVCAVALAMGYLVRYEAIGAAGGAALVVAAHTVRQRRTAGEPWAWPVASRLVLLLLPTVVAFGGFALISELIAGQPFEQLSSEYGTAAQVSQYSSSYGAGLAAHRLLTGVAQLTGIAPLAIPLAVVALRRRNRSLRVGSWAALAVLGGELAISLGLQVGNKVPFQWFRFWMAALPLEALLLADVVGTAVAYRPGVPGRRRVPGPSRVAHRLWACGSARDFTGVAVAAAVLGATAGPTWGAMNDPSVGFQETPVVAALSTSERESHPADRVALRNFETERRVAAFVDGMALGRGTVLIDTLFGYPIMLDTTRPDQFVIPSDPNFAAALADPWATGVRYLLLNSATQAGTPDALNQRFRGVYGNGANIGILVMAAESDGGNVDWRLYRLRPPGAP